MPSGIRISGFPTLVAKESFGEENRFIAVFCRPADGGFHALKVVGEVVEIFGE